MYIAKENDYNMWISSEKEIFCHTIKYSKWCQGQK